VWIRTAEGGARTVIDEPDVRPGDQEYIAEFCVEECAHCYQIQRRAREAQMTARAAKKVP
jgi:hypothetical protein